MPYNLRIPTQRTFYFKVEEGDDLISLTEVDQNSLHDFHFTFRQASAADNEQRTQALSRREWRPDGEGKMLLFDETNQDTVKRIEIYLTLVDTDLNFPDGTALEFETKNGVTKLKSRQQFDLFWKAMYPHWAEVISECCLRASPTWDPKRPDAARAGD